MLLKLTSADVETAVKEYMVRRGLPADASIDIFLRGGRKGNSGTIEVTIHPVLRTEVSENVPQSFQNVARVEIVDSYETHTEDEYFADAEQMAKDMAIFKEPEKPSLSVVETAEPEETDTVDPEDMAVFDEPEDEGVHSSPALEEVPADDVPESKPAKPKSIGSMFGKSDIPKDIPVKKNPPANPFAKKG